MSEKKIKVSTENGDIFLGLPYSNRDGDIFELDIGGREDWGQPPIIVKLFLTTQSARELKEKLEEYCINVYARREERDEQRKQSSKD